LFIKALSKCNTDPYFCVEFRKTGLEDFKFGPESHKENMIGLVVNTAQPWQVLSELDLVSLARVGATCTRLYQLAQDPFLYTVLDLRQIFHTASSATLK
jgi:hypothetical protein